jgi:hypothetical protein
MAIEFRNGVDIVGFTRPTPTPTPTPSVTPTVTPTITITPSVTPSVTPTITVTSSGVSITQTPTPTTTSTNTPTNTPTPTSTPTPTVTPTITITPSVTPSITPTLLPSFTNPTLTIGSAVTNVAQSPFVGGGNSYSFISSVNSFIDTPASSDWAVGTGDFTIEWFQYQNTTAGYQRAFTVDDFNSIDIGVSVEDATFYYWNNSGVRYSSSASTVINTWYHWAVVRQSGVTKVYRNGILRGSQISDNNNINNTIDELSIGNENTPSTIAAFRGYITNFRWVKGLAVYTGNFTTPTSQLTATAGTNPYGGSNTQAIGAGFTKLLLIP